MRVNLEDIPENWRRHFPGRFAQTSVDDKVLERFREEANTLLPQLSEDERDLWALHAAVTHPGFKSEPLPPVVLPSKRRLRILLDIPHKIAVLGLLLAILIMQAAELAHCQVTSPTASTPATAHGSAPTYNEGQRVPLWVNLGGVLQTTAGGGGGGGTSLADLGTFAQGTTPFTPAGCIFNNSITNIASGQAGAFQCTADRMLFVNVARFAGGTLGAMANYGTAPGAVLVPGVNAFITNTPSVAQSGTWTVQQGGAPWSVSASGNFGVTQQTSPWVVSVSTWASGTLGAMANYGTSPGAVLVPGVNAFITNTPTVTANAGTGTFNIQSNASVNIAQIAGTTLGIPTNFGTTPGAVIAGSVNSSTFIGTTAAVAASAGVQKVGIAGGTGASLETAAGVIDHNVKNIGNSAVTTLAAGEQKVAVEGLAASGTALIGNPVLTAGADSTGAARNVATSVDGKAITSGQVQPLELTQVTPVQSSSSTTSLTLTFSTVTAGNELLLMAMSSTTTLPTFAQGSGTATLTSSGTPLFNATSPAFAVGTFKVLTGGSLTITVTFASGASAAVGYEIAGYGIYRNSSTINIGQPLLDSSQTSNGTAASPTFNPFYTEAPSEVPFMMIGLGATQTVTAGSLGDATFSNATDANNVVVAPSGNLQTFFVRRMAIGPITGMETLSPSATFSASSLFNSCYFTLRPIIPLAIAGSVTSNLKTVAGSTVATASSGIQKVGIVGNSGVALDSTAGILDENLKNLGGVAVSTGNGTSGAGDLRINIASDNTAIANWGLGATGSAVPSGADYVAGNGSGNLTGLITCDKTALINQASTTAATVITGVASKQTHMCAIQMVAAAANNVAIIEGTTATCGTGTLGLFGGATAATGWNFSANGGIAFGNGIGQVGVTTVAANNVCILPSAATQISGSIAYTQF